MLGGMRTAAGTLLVATAAPVSAQQCGGGFERWLENFKQEAMSKGISQRTLAAAAPYMRFDQQVVNRDRGQRVFTQTFLEFSSRMVEGYRIGQGKQQLQRHAALFDRIEQRFGVPGPVLAAFWALETDFGKVMGDMPTLRSVTSLAYDCRRPELFRTQTLAALRIIERGDLTPQTMIGPFAGELGQLQFLPEHYLEYGVDFDEEADGRQGAAVALSSDFAGPLLKAEQNPVDGQLYLAGFQVWGTRSEGIRVLARLRHTGIPSPLPTAVSAGEQGILLTFGVALDPEVAADRARYAVSRWDYRRTERYGSGHFRPDGEAGEERLPVVATHLGDDGRSLLLVIPNMQEVMQMQVAYDLQATDGFAVADTVYLTVNQVTPIDLAAAGLGEVDWRENLAGAGDELMEEVALAATVDAGAEIFQRIGCVACHSVDGTTAGRLGPTMQGLFGADRPLTDGSTVRADDVYLRRSITEPDAEIVAGYQEGMPAYLGVLNDSEIESLVLYIRSLGR